jgi:hypothetical protein
MLSTLSTILILYFISVIICGIINYAPHHEDIRENGGIAPPFLTSVLDGGELSASCPCCFTPGETASGTHWIGDWVAPRAGLDVVEKRESLSAAKNQTPDCSVVQPID